MTENITKETNTPTPRTFGIALKNVLLFPLRAAWFIFNWSARLGFALIILYALFLFVLSKILLK